MVSHPMREELKYVSTECGEQCVMISGLIMMLLLCVDNWVYQQKVSWTRNNSADIIHSMLCVDASAIGSSYFGKGIGAINMDNVFCDGSESILTNCIYSDTHDCSHSEDASVICVDTQCKLYVMLITPESL